MSLFERLRKPEDWQKIMSLVRKKINKQLAPVKAFSFFPYLNGIQMTTQTNDPWAQYMAPSEVHALLATYTGDFTMEISMYTGNGKAPSLVIVESENAMLLGGRFLEMNQHGTMMGMDYQAIMTMGYNNTDRQFAFTTLTNMGTGILSLYGDWDANTKTATLYGHMINPVSKEKIIVRQTIAFTDANTILIESYDQEGEQPEIKTLQYKLMRM